MFTNYSIKNLKKGEEVLRGVRRSPSSLVGSILLAGLLTLGPFFFLLPLLRWGRWGLLLFFLLFFVGLFLVLRVVVLYKGNILYITTERLIDIDQSGFFSHTVSETTYEKVQDVSYARKGIWQMLMGTGTVFIQTAGASANLEAKDVRDPSGIHGLIMGMQRERAAAQNDEEQLSADELLKLIERLKRGLGEEKSHHLVDTRQHPKDDHDAEQRRSSGLDHE